MINDLLHPRSSSGVSLHLRIRCIVGIELTLRWNSINGVYTISSTGQAIPFVSGIGVLLTSFLKATEPGNQHAGHCFPRRPQRRGTSHVWIINNIYPWLEQSSHVNLVRSGQPASQPIIAYVESIQRDLNLFLPAVSLLIGIRPLLSRYLLAGSLAIDRSSKNDRRTMFCNWRGTD